MRTGWWRRGKNSCICQLGLFTHLDIRGRVSWGYETVVVGGPFCGTFPHADKDERGDDCKSTQGTNNTTGDESNAGTRRLLLTRGAVCPIPPLLTSWVCAIRAGTAVWSVGGLGNYILVAG
jgi:hypothetical protein